ncbi:MAG: ABC transporter substrate-binding protein [Anaerolineales bacterium]|nr:MAG: ABC transporter substrate-binding protein [Anaerolineales bacterium]
MKRKFLSWIGLVLALSVLLGACAPAATPTPEVITKVETQVLVVTATPPPPTPVPPAPEAKVKFGGLVPLTGALSEFGATFRLAGDLAQRHLLEAGFPIEMLYADTETSAIPGVDAARTLVDIEGVKALIGAAASGVTVPIAESVSIPSQVPQISNASTSPLLTVLPADEGQDFLFRTCPSDALQGVIAGKLAADLGYTTVAVLYVNNAYGLGLATQFKESFEFRGGTVTQMVPHDEAVSPTYVSELRRAAEGGAEVLYVLSYPGHATVYLKEAIEGGFFDKFLFCDGSKSVQMPQEIGAEFLAESYGTAPGSAASASYDQFVGSYTIVYGEVPPLPFMTNFYDGVVVAALAAAKCEADGNEITSVCIRDNLRFVANPPGTPVVPGTTSITNGIALLQQGEDINYEGAAGSVDFDEHGDVITPIEVWKYVMDAPYMETVSLEMRIPEL